jgi:hypothetical protein
MVLYNEKKKKVVYIFRCGLLSAAFNRLAHSFNEFAFHHYERGFGYQILNWLKGIQTWRWDQTHLFWYLPMVTHECTAHSGAQESWDHTSDDGSMNIFSAHLRHNIFLVVVSNKKMAWPSDFCILIVGA